MKQVLATPKAPPAIGPYAQGVKIGNSIYVSGQLPMDPKTRQLVQGDIGAQTERVLLNIQAILEEGESSLDDVVKFTIYLRDLNDFDEMNRVFTLFFPTGENAQRLPPARSTVQVARLPRDADIEIDAIAVIGTPYLDTSRY